MRVVIIVTVTLITFSGLSNSNKVDQSPPDVIQRRGESAKIRCEHSVNNYNQINWYRQNQEHGFTFMGHLLLKGPNTEKEFTDKIDLSGNGNSDGSLTIKSLSSNDSAVYFCAAYNNYNPAYFGSGTKLTVLDPNIKVSKRDDINVTVIKPSVNETCKKTVTLVCVVRNFYPDHVSIQWIVGGKEQTDGVATDPYAAKEVGDVGTFTISSRLKVPKREWQNAKNQFKCKVLFYNGEEYLELENSIYGIAGSDYTREDYIKKSQVMKMAYSIFIAKSGLYGLVIFVFVWRKGSSEK